MSLATLSVTAGLKNNYKISLLAVCLYCTSLYIIIFVISVEPSHPLTYAKGIAVKFFIYFLKKFLSLPAKMFLLAFLASLLQSHCLNASTIL